VAFPVLIAMATLFIILEFVITLVLKELILMELLVLLVLRGSNGTEMLVLLCAMEVKSTTLQQEAVSVHLDFIGLDQLA